MYPIEKEQAPKPPREPTLLVRKVWSKSSYMLLAILAAVVLIVQLVGIPMVGRVGHVQDHHPDHHHHRGKDSAKHRHQKIQDIRKRATAIIDPASAVTTDIQVYPPVLVPTSSGVLEFTNGTSAVKTDVKASKVTTQTLMVHTFANSYYVPFVGNYTPPKGKDFNRIVFTLNVEIAGVQYDRLGSVWLGDTEIWRTTTAEPTTDGVTWTYVKDMSHFLSLFMTEQTLIFSLNNIYDSTYTGEFNTTLTATFFTSEDTVDPADEIIAISSHLGSTGQPSIWSVPSDLANNTVAIPKRTRKAVFTIAATGQSEEEFWYTNLLTVNENYFGDGFFYGYSPFREIQLYIDDELAGVVWPFPNIFTGGIAPGLWYPIVGIDAFDLRENEIDITPWLPLLCDGKKHTYSIKIAGVSSATGNGKGEITDGVGSYWLISGKIFLWLDPAGSETTGTITEYAATKPTVEVTSSVGTDASGVNETLAYSVTVARTFGIKSTVTTANGTSTATWHQKLSYFNFGYVYAYGYNQENTQSTNGTDKSSSGYAREISYPLFVSDVVYVNDADTFESITALVSRGQTIQIAGNPVFPTGLQSFDEASSGYPLSQASTLSTTQNATAYYSVNVTSDTGESYGSNMQEMVFFGNSVDPTTSSSTYPTVTGSEEFYHRYVEAVNGTYITDEETLIGEVTVDYAHPVSAAKKGLAHFVAANGKQLTGKGQ